MTNDRQTLLRDLEDYASPFPVEIVFRDRFIQLLHHPDCFTRNLLHAHLTGSAWITDPTGDYALLIEHKKLGKWLQPGGHADGIEDLYEVARQEALEETGLTLVGNREIFDLDIHRIPLRHTVPEHDHYDVRFHFIVDRQARVRKNKESKNIRWFHFTELETVTQGNESIRRMSDKSRHRLSSGNQ